MVERPSDKNVIATKWIFKIKHDEYGNVVKNNVRLVTKGYAQVEDKDFEKTFALVARLESIRILLTIVYQSKLKIFQMDVNSVFLNDLLQEEVFVEQLEGFMDLHRPKHFYQPKKALNSLKKSPRAWYERLTEFLLDTKFSRGSIDKTLFIKKKDANILIVQIYVGDIIFGSTYESSTLKFAQVMRSEFVMSMEGGLKFFLGL